MVLLFPYPHFSYRSTKSLSILNDIGSDGLSHLKTFLDINIGDVTVLSYHEPVESLVHEAVNGLDAHKACHRSVS